jgi:carbonic anhydrase
LKKWLKSLKSRPPNNEMNRKSSPMRLGLSARILTVVSLVALPAAAPAAWQTIAVEQGRRIEIDRESIIPAMNGTLDAKGRIVLARPIIDPKTSMPYNVIELESRYDCAKRARTTLKRSYYREDGNLLREDDVAEAFELPIRGGTPDDLLLREACRPNETSAKPSENRGMARTNGATADLRKANEALIREATKKNRRNASPSVRPASRPAAQTSAETRRGPTRAWTYEGTAGPEHWGKLHPDYTRCTSGRRQSPIDLRDTFAVDLEPIQFLYKASPFRVVDTAYHLQLTVYGGGIQAFGKNYRLSEIRFHNPSEFSIAGRFFDMEAQLIHRADDGRLAIVSVLLGKGDENPVIQVALNNMPLERGKEFAPSGRDIDVGQLLPTDRRYFTFMGSLTVPPCTEDVLWIVIKQQQRVSAEQLAMFRRLYPPNARPVQPPFGRIVKESR